MYYFISNKIRDKITLGFSHIFLFTYCNNQILSGFTLMQCNTLKCQSCKLLTTYYSLYSYHQSKYKGNKNIEHNYLQEMMHKKKKMTKFIYNSPSLPSLPKDGQRFAEFPLPNEPENWEGNFMKPLTPPVAFCLPLPAWFLVVCAKANFTSQY